MEKVRNLVVKSIPAQKLPKHKNSAHLCEITLLEGNSPLLFQVIFFMLSSNSALQQAKTQMRNWVSESEVNLLNKNNIRGADRERKRKRKIDKTRTEQNKTEQKNREMVCVFEVVICCCCWFGLWYV